MKVKTEPGLAKRAAMKVKTEPGLECDKKKPPSTPPTSLASSTTTQTEVTTLIVSPAPPLLTQPANHHFSMVTPSTASPLITQPQVYETTSISERQNQFDNDMEAEAKVEEVEDGSFNEALDHGDAFTSDILKTIFNTEDGHLYSTIDDQHYKEVM